MPLETVDESAAAIKLKTFQGASAMVFRQLAILAINLVTGIVLARVLAPDDFGIYIISTFVISTLTLFTDVGLGAALIQRHEEPTLDQYRAVFTFQLLFVSALVCGVYFAAPLLVRLYKIEAAVVWFLRTMALTLLVASIGSISVIKLERRLAYTVFARIDILVAVVEKAVVVALALLGYGYWCFLISALCGVLVRVVATYRAAPWSVGFHWDKAFLQSAMKFGGMYQLAGMTSLLRDNLNALLVGPVFGPRPVGYLNWAHSTALYGSQIFAQVVSRVNFPSLSRAQHDPLLLSDIVNKTLRLLNVLTIPILAIMMALIHEIVALIYTTKWIDAIPSFYCYALLMIAGNITTTLSGYLLAVGEARINLLIMVVWTIMVWLFALLFMTRFGFISVIFSALLSVVFISIWLILVAKRSITIKVVSAIFKPLLVGSCVGGLVYIVRGMIALNIVSLALVAGGGFALSLWLNMLSDRELRNDFRIMWKHLAFGA